MKARYNNPLLLGGKENKW